MREMPAAHAFALHERAEHVRFSRLERPAGTRPLGPRLHVVTGRFVEVFSRDAHAQGRHRLPATLHRLQGAPAGITGNPAWIRDGRDKGITQWSSARASRPMSRARRGARRPGRPAPPGVRRVAGTGGAPAWRPGDMPRRLARPGCRYRFQHPGQPRSPSPIIRTERPPRCRISRRSRGSAGAPTAGREESSTAVTIPRILPPVVCPEKAVL